MVSYFAARPTQKTFLGLFLITVSLIQLELFLTRIYSVIMYYHFAFMAISLAMFGIAAGAVWVELRVEDNPHDVLARSATVYAASSALCFAIQLYFPVNPGREIIFTALSFLVISVPFVLAGIVICVALTRFPGYTGALYTADLAGSAMGCILAIPILDHIPAPTAIILNAAVAALGAYVLGRSSSARIRSWAIGVCLLLLAVAAVNPSLGLVRLRWAKGRKIGTSGLYEKWNALSRIWIGQASDEPLGWGLSSKYQANHPIDQYWLSIDSGAATVITRFDGNLDTVDHLKYDVTALSHYLRPNASVLVIGVGGGRDVLTSLAFHQRRIVGVEINHDILDVLKSRFAAYSGNLSQQPGVILVNDEARSYIARSNEKFDIIQASLIDTWAATAAGAYSLTENGLYTREAWITFLEHLTPDGILTISRWEWQRLASLAMATLSQIGVRNPREHVLIVKKRDGPSGSPGITTFLVSRRPFRPEEVRKLMCVSRDLDFVPLLTPEYAATAQFVALFDPARYSEFVRSYPINIAAPTDDSPFFFQMLRAEDLLKDFKNPTLYIQAVKVLGTLLAIVVVLSLGVILLPLVLSGQVREGRSIPLTLYFASIGLGFMLVEIGQLERLILFLGHPVYGLSVVIFTLLSASSCGSWCASRLGRWIWILPVFLSALIWFGPLVTKEFLATPTLGRIAVSFLLLFPVGFFMGMAFPVGMELVSSRPHPPTAWYWGINGALSVVSSVLALLIAIFWGLTVTLTLGLGAYILALGMLAVERAKHLQSVGLVSLANSD